MSLIKQGTVLRPFLCHLQLLNDNPSFLLAFRFSFLRFHHMENQSSFIQKSSILHIFESVSSSKSSLLKLVMHLLNSCATIRLGTLLISFLFIYSLLDKASNSASGVLPV